MDGELSTEDLAALLDDDADVRVVDIRPPGAFARGHIPGSENIPFGKLPNSVERLDGANRVVTVCPHGEASQRAARLVASYEGLADDARVESLREGVEGWDGDLERADERSAAASERTDGDASPGDGQNSDEGPETDAPF